MVKAFTPWGVKVNFYTLWCNGQHCKEYPLCPIQTQPGLPGLPGMIAMMNIGGKALPNLDSARIARIARIIRIAMMNMGGGEARLCPF